MKMNKILATMAAAAVSVSAFAAMNLTSASAADQIAQAALMGGFGTENAWDYSGSPASVAAIDGDAQYEVTWTVSEATTPGNNCFLSVIIKPVGDVENFTTDTFPDLSITLDEVYVDGVLLEGYDASSAIDVAYYEGSDPGASRVYLRGDWAGNPTRILGDDQAINESIKVVFTVSGTGQEGTSNVTPTEEPSSEEDTSTSEEDTSASEENTSSSEENTSSSEENTSSSEENTSSSEENTSSSEENTSSSEENTSSSEENTSSTDATTSDDTTTAATADGDATTTTTAAADADSDSDTTTTVGTSVVSDNGTTSIVTVTSTTAAADNDGDDTTTTVGTSVVSDNGTTSIVTVTNATTTSVAGATVAGGGNGGAATTAASASTEASASTGDLGVGIAVSALAVAGAAAFITRKKD